MSRDTDELQLSEDLPVGGQAVIEGVMVRARERIVTAVRTPDRGIVVREDRHVPWSRRLRPLGIPVLRGAISFFEMMLVGMRSLSFSADMAMEAEEAAAGEEPRSKAISSGWKQSLMLGLTLVISLAVGVAIFFFLPLFAAQLTGVSRDALQFNLVAGAVRTALLLAYMWGIGQWGEIRRVFEYHGAEHKTIFAVESDVDLTVERARAQGRLHPRCGTSFLLIVVLVSIFVFAMVDTAFVHVFGHAQSLLERFATHLTVLPLVSGLSFELLKLSGRKRHHPLTRILITPGLWLQRITTREPSDDQLEVALVAVRHALGEPPLVEYTMWDGGEVAPAPAAGAAAVGGQAAAGTVSTS